LREKGVKMKLSPVKSIVKDKRVVLVDDSIVRGTTSLKIVKMLREAGAAEVHVRIASAPLKYTCYYGVDVHTPEELISNSNSVEKVRELIGADSLAFLSHEGMYEAGRRDDLCIACFNRKYPTKLY
jgi:amidophosphoribosyltransferase